MIYGYVRVSTDKQTDKNQRYEIQRYCDQANIKVDKWISETISGTKDVESRKLGNLLDNLQQGDTIICSEISRLGRSLFMIISILDKCMSAGAKVWTIKDNFRLGDDISSKVLAFAFGLSAEIERKLISQRTREALARKKAEGIKLGRPPGPGKRKLDEHHDEIVQLLEIGMNKRQIARLYDVNASTVHEYLNAKGLRNIVSRKKAKERA